MFSYRTHQLALCLFSLANQLILILANVPLDVQLEKLGAATAPQGIGVGNYRGWCAKAGLGRAGV